MSGELSLISQWPPANYATGYERTWLLPILLTTWIIATIILGMRVYLRIRDLAGRFGYDDVMILLGWAAGTALTVFLALAVKYHIGRHAWDIPLDNWTHIAFIYFVSEPTFLLCGCFTKVSVLLFYRRLSENAVLRWWKILLLVCIAFTVLWTLALIFAQLPLCSPTEAYWKQFDLSWHQPYTCTSINPFTILAGSLAVISDLYATVLPCWLVWNLQMARRTKIGLYIIFSLGLIVTIFSIVRTVWIMKATSEPDLSWDIYWAMLFLQLEAQLGIICTCLPAMNIFFKRYVREPISTFSSQRSRPKFSRLDTTESSASISKYKGRDVVVQEIDMEDFRRHERF